MIVNPRIKSILWIVSLLMVPLLASAGISGLIIEHSYLAAKQKAEEKGKPYIVQFTATWCTPCTWQDQTSLKDPEIVDIINSGFVFVLMDIDEFEGYSLKQYYQINNIPALLIFSKDHKLINRVEGSANKTKLIEILEATSEGKTTDIADAIQANPAVVNRSAPVQNKNMRSSSPRIQDNRMEDSVKPEPPTSFGGHAYAIQIGAFSSLQNARSKEIEVQKRTSESTLITSTDRDGIRVFKVYVGQYESEKECRSVQKRLTALQLDGWVKKISLSEKL